MARAPAKAGPLTKRLEATQTTAKNPLVEQPRAAFEPEPGLDDFDLHNGILDHLGFDRLLGSASEAIMEARRLSGPGRDEKITRAIRLLSRSLMPAVPS